MKEFKLRLAPFRRVKKNRNDVLNQALRASGSYLKTLRFKTKRERLNYLINIFKPYANKLTKGKKQSVTFWLKHKQLLTDKEVKQFYQTLGRRSKIE